MSTTRVGIGIDTHRFADPSDALASARPLVLGGVVVATNGGLVGHSDADALADALCDALLGAAGLGDIGDHFPPDDPAYAGADSLVLLARCVEAVGKAGFRVENADCTVIAERPHLKAHRAEMGARLTEVLGAPVNVKATSPEGLGALGRAEGISCLAVVLLDR